MMYNANKWQSINKTNQESEYLQLCRSKAYYIVQHTFLTEAALLTLLLYKTSSGYFTSFASQVRVTEWIQVRNCKIFILNFSSIFYSVDNVHIFIYSLCLQCRQFYSTLSTTFFFFLSTMSTILQCRQCRHWLCTMSILVCFLYGTFRNTTLHVLLRMIDFDCLQWPHDISRAYCLFLLEFLNSLPKIFLSFSVRTSFQQFLSGYTRLI